MAARRCTGRSLTNLFIVSIPARSVPELGTTATLPLSSNHGAFIVPLLGRKPPFTLSLAVPLAALLGLTGAEGRWAADWTELRSSTKLSGQVHAGACRRHPECQTSSAAGRLALQRRICSTVPNRRRLALMPDTPTGSRQANAYGPAPEVKPVGPDHGPSPSALQPRTHH